MEVGSRLLPLPASEVLTFSLTSLTSCPGACCCPSQSLKGAVGATLVLSGARSALFHLPGVKWMLNESCDVGTADLRESSRSLDCWLFTVPSPRFLPVWGGRGQHICPSSVAQITPTRKEMLVDTDK